MTRNFLGASARFPLGVFSLAATFKVPVSIVFAFKETATHYHFFGSPLIVPDNNMDRKQAVDNLIDNFVLALQEKVRQYPEQWFNYYNFWKH